MMGEKILNGTDILRVLLDEDRLRVLGLLSLAPRSVTELAEAAGLRTGDVRHHLRSLRRAGLVINESTNQNSLYSFDVDGIQALKREFFAGPTENLSDDEKTLQAFVRDGKLVSIPVKAAKLQIVLGWLVELFEPECRYPEAEVNAVINQVHEDHATLRRLLVDYGLMERAGGIYWRV
jgi:biotin operon repressor